MIIRVSSGKMMLAQHLAKRGGKHPTKPHGEELYRYILWELGAPSLENGDGKP